MKNEYIWKDEKNIVGKMRRMHWERCIEKTDNILGKMDILGRMNILGE